MATILQKKSVKERKFDRGKRTINQIARTIAPYQTVSLIKGSNKLVALENCRNLLVYILRCDDCYKIGFTNVGIAHRIETLQMGNPYTIHLVMAIITERAKKLEKVLHSKFANKHVRGEWFKLELPDFKEIETFAFDFMYENKAY